MQESIIITGQTATGKTRLAIEKAQKVKGYLINADSRQLYKKLDIITGKDVPSDEAFHHVKSVLVGNPKISVDIGYYERKNVQIWGYDMIDPRKTFTAAHFAQATSEIINNTINNNRIPIIIGGTYLYIKAIVDGLDPTPSANKKLREKLAQLPVEKLQKRFEEIAPKAYKALNNSERNNPQRLIRRIEIAEGESTDEAIKPLIQAQEFIGLQHKNRAALEKAITKRIEQRIAAGAMNEARKLIKEGYTENDPGLNAIGYPQLIAHIQGEYTLDTAIELWKIAEMQYAKRQITFMQQDKRITWNTISQAK